MIRRRRAGEAEPGLLEDAVWLYSYADLITQLLLFSVLMMVASMAIQSVPTPKAKPKPDKLSSLVDDLQKVVRKSELQNLVAVDRGADRVIVRIRSVLLFAEGQATLAPGAKRVLSDLVAVLKPIPNALRVEGHTDDTPIRNAQFPSNWELSTARAISVVRQLEPLGIVSKRLAVAGYGEYHPIVPNDGAEQKAMNRRVEIIIVGGRR